MRARLFLVATLIMAGPTLAMAQTPPASSPSPAVASASSARPYTTTTTDIGTLLDDPAAKAILDQYVPGFTKNEQVDMARGMTLKDVQQYAPDQLSDKVLAEIDAAFAKLPPKS